MNDKYYTPEIEEFHIGFEFESKYVLFNQNLEWKKVVLDNSHNWFWQSYDEDAVETEFRVKYLDREDIESLGWKPIEGQENHPMLTLDSNDMRYYLFIREPFSKIEIRADHPSLNFGNFLGVIKNKSELKRIMKMIGI